MHASPSKKNALTFSAFKALFFLLVFSSCASELAIGQSSNKADTPAFSFEGGKRIQAIPSKVSGMREYDGRSDVASRNPGTGIVEVKDGTHVSRLSPRLLSPGDPSAPTNASAVGGDNKFVSTRGSVSFPTTKFAAKPAARSKQATTTVQMLGPDGKMQYKQVPFIGEVASTKRAPGVTDLKDGEGKVKEYAWARKNR
jgi:hypothetical protein